LAAVRVAELVSQVYPISHASGDVRSCRAWPCGHGQNSMFQKRVDPKITPSLTRTVANGTAVPASRQASAVST
jgi:hypothetical protein